MAGPERNKRKGETTVHPAKAKAFGAALARGFKHSQAPVFVDSLIREKLKTARLLSSSTRLLSSFSKCVSSWPLLFLLFFRDLRVLDQLLVRLFECAEGIHWREKDKGRSRRQIGPNNLDKTRDIHPVVLRYISH